MDTGLRLARLVGQASAGLQPAAGFSPPAPKLFDCAVVATQQNFPFPSAITPLFRRELNPVNREATVDLLACKPEIILPLLLCGQRKETPVEPISRLTVIGQLVAHLAGQVRLHLGKLAFPRLFAGWSRRHQVLVKFLTNQLSPTDAVSIPRTGAERKACRDGCGTGQRD